MHEHQWKRSGEFYACNPPIWMNTCECGALSAIRSNGTYYQLTEPVEGQNPTPAQQYLDSINQINRSISNG